MAGTDLDKRTLVGRVIRTVQSVRRPRKGHAYVTFGTAGQVGGINGINSRGLAMLGKPRERVIGQKCFEVIHGEPEPNRPRRIPKTITVDSSLLKFFKGKPPEMTIQKGT